MASGLSNTSCSSVGVAAVVARHRTAARGRGRHEHNDADAVRRGNEKHRNTMLKRITQTVNNVNGGRDGSIAATVRM